MTWPHDVTVITVTETNGVTEYNATYLHGVLLDSHAGGIVYKSGLQSDDNATLYIPESVNATDPDTKKTKTYLPPAQYILQPDKSNIWTIITSGQRSGCDTYVLKGRVDTRERIDYQTIRKSGVEVYRAASCDYRDYGSKRLHHWQVGLK